MDVEKRPTLWQNVNVVVLRLLDVPNEGNCKERVGREFGMSVIAIMDEGTSFGASDHETLLQGFGHENKGNQSKDMKNQSKDMKNQILMII